MFFFTCKYHKIQYGICVHDTHTKVSRLVTISCLVYPRRNVQVVLLVNRLLADMLVIDFACSNYFHVSSAYKIQLRNKYKFECMTLWLRTHSRDIGKPPIQMHNRYIFVRCVVVEHIYIHEYLFFAVVENTFA